MESKARILGSNTQYIRYPLEFFLAEMECLGLRQLDFTPKAPHFFCSHSHCTPVDSLLRALDSHHLKVSAVTPPPYRYAITAPEGVQRQRTEQYYKTCIDLTARLGCGYMVLDSSGACWDLSEDELLANAEGMIRTLCEHAQEQDVRLLLAPVMGKETPLIAEAPVLNTAQDLQQMLHRVNCDHLGVCLDTNVMSACGGTMMDWFSRLGDRTQLVRLCDGNYHGWRAWGDGVLPMERYVRELDERGYRGAISLYLGGERYVENPSQAAAQTLTALCGEG